MRHYLTVLDLTLMTSQHCTASRPKKQLGFI